MHLMLAKLCQIYHECTNLLFSDTRNGVHSKFSVILQRGYQIQLMYHRIKRHQLESRLSPILNPILVPIPFSFLSQYKSSSQFPTPIPIPTHVSIFIPYPHPSSHLNPNSLPFPILSIIIIINILLTIILIIDNLSKQNKFNFALTKQSFNLHQGWTSDL